MFGLKTRTTYRSSLLRTHVLKNAGNKMSTIKTLTGIDFDYINPTIDMYNIKDVAYGLSYEKRYGNQTNPLFSVGKHSLFVSYLMERFDGKDNQNMNAFAGLIHDLSEYLLRDLPAGVKHLDLLAGYRTLENTIQEVGYQAFGVDKTKVLNL